MTYLPAPTIKSTKAELLAAFEELRRQYEAAQTEQVHPSAARRQEEEALIAKTAGVTPDSVEAKIAELRGKLQEHVDGLYRELGDASKQLNDLRAAIAIESARLKEARQIELTVEALGVLMADYARTEKELADKRQQIEEDLQAEMARKKKEWEREQEEYAYNIKIVRRKEQDAYEAEVAKKDAQREEKFALKAKELADREAALQLRREDFARLEKLAAEHPTEMERAAQEAEQRVSETLRREFATEKKLLEQEWRAEKNMLEARVQSLQETTKTQSQEADSLKNSLATATQHAQTLAATVIESVSGMKQMKTSDAPKE